MRKITMIALPIAIFVAGLLVGSFTLGDQNAAQASPSAQEISYEVGWLVEDFGALNFEEAKWTQLGQEAGCVIYSSNPGENDPANVVFFKIDQEFDRSYPRRGARVRVCGDIVHFPPVTEGSLPREDN